MSLVTVDPFAWIDQLRRTTKLFEWLNLIFQLGYSAAVTFLGITGTALAAGTPTGIAIGRGMVAVAVVLAAFFGHSALTAGMMLVRPSEIAQKELQTDLAITERTPNLPKK